MSGIINPVTAAIIREAKDGDTIRAVAGKTGFAYSAVYRWVTALAAHGVFEVNDEGNRKRIYARHNALYSRFAGLMRSVSEADRDRAFWAFVKKTSLKVRLAGGTAITLWTRGSYVTGDFFDNIYVVEVTAHDAGALKSELSKRAIRYTEGKQEDERPLVFLSVQKDVSIERIEGIPVVPLNELVTWCKKLNLDAALEHLDALYHLNLETRHAEVRTNV